MVEELETTKPVKSGENQEIERDEKGRYKPGVSGNITGAGAGRPKKGLKEYDRERFANMSDEEKEEFLKGLSPEMRYKMAEGNPHQSSDVGVSGKLTIEISKEIADKHNVSNQSTVADSEGQTQV